MKLDNQIKYWASMINESSDTTINSNPWEEKTPWEGEEYKMPSSEGKKRIYGINL